MEGMLTEKELAERQLAVNVCNLHAKGIVDDMGGITIGGSTIAEKYNEKWGGSYDCQDCVDAIYHWVISAGYNLNGIFVVVYSDYRL